MINSVMNIGGHMTDRIICDLKGSPLTLANLYPSMYQFRLKLIDRDPTTGNNFQVYPTVTGISASIGLVYAEPLAGTFKLRYGTGTPTAEIDFKEPAGDLLTKLQALPESATYGLDVIYQPTPSTWVMRFLTPDPSNPTPLNGISNELEPETFIRIREYTQNAQDWVEVRLIQGPIASTSGIDTILPTAPTVIPIRDGYTEDDILFTIIVDEIQSISVPTEFTGTYTVRYQGRESTTLSVNSGPTDIATAINAMYGDGVVRFVVTNPVANQAYVEFVGPFAGKNMDLLDIHVTSTGLADLFFQLNLFTTEVANALRTNASVDASFEIRLHIVDPAVPDDPGQDMVLFQEPVTIVRPLHWEGLEEAAPIDWLFPPNPKDYVPFNVDQVITGSQSYSTAFGDGLAVSYIIAHHLNADALTVEVRENANPGRLLRDEEYSVEFDDTGMALTITMPTAPATNSLLISVLATGDVSAFLNHTHTIGQIVGLEDLLNSMLGRISALESIFATFTPPGGGTNPFAVPGSSSVLTITIADQAGLLPTNRSFGAVIDLTKLPNTGLLLPAVHDVIELGTFTANPTTNVITLGTPYSGTPALVDGQRARIDIPIPYDTGVVCTFDATTNIITAPGAGAAGIVNNRQVKFFGGVLPPPISPFVVYYVIDFTADTFKISSIKGGSELALISDGDINPHHLWTVPEVPDGLSHSVDYFMIAPTSTTFKLSETIGGAPIDIGPLPGYPPIIISTIDEAPSVGGTLPDPVPLAGNAYSVREDILIRGGRGIRSETVHAGDIIASDGRVWYHATRSDVPGSNSFYPTEMEVEAFQFAVNENMLPITGVLTMTFNFSAQMFKHDTDTQFVVVVEVGDLPEDVTPAPTGPNLYEVIWNKTPVMQQRIIVTDVLVLHTFGAQITHNSDGTFSSNKKLYGVQLAGDAVPASSNFVVRVRMIEFDTEDNVSDASGIVYWKIDTIAASITGGSPTPPVTAPAP